jgi:hypothetical protein
MIDLTTVFDKFSEKKTPDKVRAFLNFVFVASITSFVFQRVYFNYHIIDIANYQLVFDFFVSGNFFIPLLLFLVTYEITKYIPSSIFILTNVYISEWIEKNWIMLL